MPKTPVLRLPTSTTSVDRPGAYVWVLVQPEGPSHVLGPTVRPLRVAQGRLRGPGRKRSASGSRRRVRRDAVPRRTIPDLSPCPRSGSDPGTQVWEAPRRGTDDLFTLFFELVDVGVEAGLASVDQSFFPADRSTLEPCTTSTQGTGGLFGTEGLRLHCSRRGQEPGPPEGRWDSTVSLEYCPSSPRATNYYPPPVEGRPLSGLDRSEGGEPGVTSGPRSGEVETGWGGVPGIPGLMWGEHPTGPLGRE